MKNLLRALLLLFLVLTPGCWLDDNRPVPQVADSSKPTQAQLEADKKMQDQIAALRGDNDAQIKTIEEGKARIAANDAIIKAAQESNAKLTGDIRDLVVEARQEKIYWLAGILGFAALGLTVLAYLVPLRRVAFLKLAACAGALASILLYVAEWAAYFEVIGCVFLVGTVAVLIIELAVHSQAIKHLVANWKAYAAKVPADVKTELDKASVAAQPSHIKTFIDELFKKL